MTVNLASWLLARAAVREKEFALSRALGASGPAVVRATLIEGGLLGLLGGIGGTLAAIWGTRLLVSLGPANLPCRETIAVDWSIAAVVITVGTVLGFIAAAAPATWASLVSLPWPLAAAAVRVGTSTGRMRRSLIVAQVALSLVLIRAGGLVVRSFERLLAADGRFQTQKGAHFPVGVGNWLFLEDRVLRLSGPRRERACSSVQSQTHQRHDKFGAVRDWKRQLDIPSRSRARRYLRLSHLRTCWVL